MADITFNTTEYGVDPWENVVTNQRQWYDPTLRRVYRQNTVYTNMVPYATQPMLPHNARTMTFNQAFDFHANTDPIGFRDTTKDRAFLDGQQVDITFTRYGFVTAMHKSDDLVSYWIEQGMNQTGLLPIIRERVARNVVETHDKLIRNAFLNTEYTSLPNSSYTGADQITTSDTYTLDMIDHAILRAQLQNVWTEPAEGLGRGALLCIDSPSQIASIIQYSSTTSEKPWIELQKYASLKPYNDYEIGSYHSSRHLQTPNNVLFNCGARTAQSQIAAAAGVFDGAPDPASAKVDLAYKVGQPGNVAVHYIQLQTGMASAFSVGDIVTISKTLNQSAAHAALPKIRVLGAPAFDEGTLVNSRVVAVDTSNSRISLWRPLMVDYSTEVNTSGTGAASPGSSCYGFVTKGVHLHVSVCIAAPEGIVAGVAVPPRVYTLDPIDDFKSIYRFSWDAYEGFNLWRPEAYEVFVTAGPVRIKDRLM